jgi:hypothetical protein
VRSLLRPQVPGTRRASYELAGVLTYPLDVRKNTLLALILLLTAITIAGLLGALRMWQLAG